MAKSSYLSRPPEYAMRRLISAEMKLASMTGVPKTLRVTGVLLGWDVKRFFCIRWRSESKIERCIGLFSDGKGLTLGNNGVGSIKDGPGGPVVFFQINRFYTREI